MKSFMEENLPFIIFGIIIIGLIYGFVYFANRQYDLYEKALNYAIETNTPIEIK